MALLQLALASNKPTNLNEIEYKYLYSRITATDGFHSPTGATVHGLNPLGRGVGAVGWSNGRSYRLPGA